MDIEPKTAEGLVPAPKPETVRPTEEDPLPGGWARENLEAIIVAVIMALVIRHFCVEAFKIPTSSMEPTLFGNHPSEAIVGDRILVNKFVYRFSDPRRWDVIVFKYPLDRSKNFIKRLIGLPGEEIRLWGGNLYVKREAPGTARGWRIARKPPRVQKAIWQEIYPDCLDEEPGYWAPSERADFRAFEGGGELRALGGGEAWLFYRGKLHSRRDRNVAYREQLPMGEIRLACRAAVDRGALQVDLDLTDIKIRARLPAGEGGAALWVDGTQVASSPAHLIPGREATFAFENVDGVLRMEMDGEVLFEHLFDPGTTYSPIMRPRLRVGVAGGEKLTLKRLTLFRDIFYLEEGRGILREREEDGLRIPEDSYFVLGDNCTSSKDSRLWRRIRFRLLDGREIEGEYEAGTVDTSRGEIHLLDTTGVRWHLTRREVTNFEARARFAPFVPRENLIGQAFLVFWPLKQVHLID
ncbi:MAG: signal peptidase I [Planctomycetota bacterium]|jgi:signal peptidase I